MNVTTGKGALTRLYIENAPALDPITVIFEDFQPGVGRLTIVCYGRSWTAFWGSMGDCDLRGFLRVVSDDYVTGKMSTGKEKKNDIAYLKRIVSAVLEAVTMEVEA